MFIKHKYIITLYSVTGDTSIVSTGWDYVSTYVGRDVCIYNPEDINKWEHITEVLLQYGVGGGVTAVWAVLFNICNSEF